MRTPVLGFYERLARDFHLIYPDWEAAITWQSRVIHHVIRGLGRMPPLDVLDCACGIGTQSIGLAMLGYRLLGTDLSAHAIRRARREVRARGARARFVEADFRALHKATRDTFDVVICCDNSLAHMMTSHDLARAAHSMAARLRPAGLLIASIRDYDELTRTRPAFTPPVCFRDPAGSRIVFQHWNWRRDVLPRPQVYRANRYAAANPPNVIQRKMIDAIRIAIAMRTGQIAVERRWAQQLAASSPINCCGQSQDSPTMSCKPRSADS
jgi:SAM-dependent methyltransferase